MKTTGRSDSVIDRREPYHDAEAGGHGIGTRNP